MAISSLAKKRTSYKLGAPHIILWISLVIAIFAICQYIVIPYGTAKFVLPLFRPSGERMLKIGFVKFDGLVWASTSKENERLLKGKEVEIRKDLINKEYIFDFTFKQRTAAENGYVKASNEFYAKSETLGEHAIILEPWVGFWILALVLGVAFATFITMVLPSSFGFMAVLFDRQIDNTKIKIRLQTGFSDSVVEILTLPNDKLQERDRQEVEDVFRKVWDRTVSEIEETSNQKVALEDLFDDDTEIVSFRNDILYNRIKEFFSDFVVKEIEDTKDGLLWRRNHFFVPKGLRLYMAHHFTEKYSNNVTGMAYGGAAFLIVAVGVRGLKFIPAAKPSFILLAIFLEFTMLTLLAVTLFYTEEEERMDKMLKKMEDANRSQLDILKEQQKDIHILSNALVGQTAEIIKTRVENVIVEYMSSENNVERVVAEQIADKILLGIKDVK